MKPFLLAAIVLGVAAAIVSTRHCAGVSRVPDADSITHAAVSTANPHRDINSETENPTPTETKGRFWVDANGDGIPDGAELQTFQDRNNFRRWFTAIAEMQFYQLSDSWIPEQRDCAGLVRFAMREALRRHDRAWFQKMGQAYETVAPDVAGFDLGRNPLGEKIFRTDLGAFQQADLGNGKLSEFADGQALRNFNSVFVSRDRRQAQPGDLLFFYQPWVQKFPYHVMVFLGPARLATNGAADWVVYHTGSSPTDQGTVKKVELSVLDHHPDPRWRPIQSNRNFLGFYRLKIIQ